MRWSALFVTTAMISGSALAPAKAEQPAQAAPSQAAIVSAFQQGAYGFGSGLELLREAIKGFEISPVRIDLDTRNPFLVGLGSYIVNAQGGCNDCHTNPPYAQGGNPYLGQKKQVNTAGFLGGGQPFGPGIVSRNLIPEHGLPAGRTYAQFQQIMRTGIDLDHAHPKLGPLLQVMPWPLYQNMTDLDLRAIYTYLSTIPAVHVQP